MGSVFSSPDLPSCFQLRRTTNFDDLTQVWNLASLSLHQQCHAPCPLDAQPTKSCFKQIDNRHNNEQALVTFKLSTN
ncbi:hypothetical protein PRIPAC_97986 [Pristionchus pacificus]|uniref:Uncharacterized protein n=1 Tax=Pristionchus pacificus TaxID=54126 RepID=A0A2A6CUD1_PRIPA|nr:hypothetical protein PRIPAC_97986 [Pristionchus pacificus]|eukprot:PDM81710.1 hypothetical protein PRIPAC_30691 [Pristionchus pacificus]